MHAQPDLAQHKFLNINDITGIKIRFASNRHFQHIPLPLRPVGTHTRYATPHVIYILVLSPEWTLFVWALQLPSHTPKTKKGDEGSYSLMDGPRFQCGNVWSAMAAH